MKTTTERELLLGLPDRKVNILPCTSFSDKNKCRNLKIRGQLYGCDHGKQLAHPCTKPPLREPQLLGFLEPMIPHAKH
jgi:hypothetical protein